MFQIREAKKTRMFQEPFRITTGSCYMNKRATIVHKSEAKVLASETQDLLKKFQTFQEDLNETAAIQQIAIAEAEQPLDVSSSLRPWLKTAKSIVEEIKTLEDKRQEDEKQTLQKVNNIVNKLELKLKCQHP